MATVANDTAERLTRSDLVRVIPFILMHVACLSVFFVGVSWIAVAVAIVVYFTRVFGLTGFYHRYFSHRAFKTSRWFQFVGAAIGATAVQRGPLWWAAHHRDHHRYSDKPGDVHSPHVHSFLWSHMGWFMARKNYELQGDGLKDLWRYPELRFLDRHDWVAPTVLAVGMYGLGAACERWAPGLGTSGWQMLVWGFLISTIALYHVTYAINSLAHTFGSGDILREMRAVIIFGSRWSRSAKGGTTIITTTRPQQGKAFIGGRSTSPTTFYVHLPLSGSFGICGQFHSVCSMKAGQRGNRRCLAPRQVL